MASRASDYGKLEPRLERAGCPLQKYLKIEKVRNEPFTIMNSGKFEIQIASPPDREKLVALIMIGSEQWAELNRESEK